MEEMELVLELTVTIVVEKNPVPEFAPKSTSSLGSGSVPQRLRRDSVSGGTFSGLDTRGMGRAPQAGLNSMLGIRWGNRGDRGI